MQNKLHLEILVYFSTQRKTNWGEVGEQSDETKSKWIEYPPISTLEV